MSESRDELSQIETLLRAHSRRLHALQIQQAMYGANTNPGVTIEIEDIERQVADLCARRNRLQPDATVIKRPYKGLETFGEVDAEFFFGRDRLVIDLLRKIEQAPFLAVLGPSGSGKSSAVLAGLVPALRGGALSGSDNWHYAVLKPGAYPLKALARVLKQPVLNGSNALLLAAEHLLNGRQHARLTLVVDQAEELWTLAPSDTNLRERFIDQQQRPFLQMLFAAAQAPDTPVCAILTLRADFLPRALESAEMSALLNRNSHFVTSMNDAELRAAIERPAAALGHSFQAGLVDRLIEQTRGQPGTLPLLEYLLAELWTDRTNEQLTWAAFNRSGGVEGTLARHADAILDKHYQSYEQREQLRTALMRLVQPGEEADTRRRIPLADLATGNTSSDYIRTLLDPLVRERLLTLGRDEDSGQVTVEVAHEALIRSWPTLREWVDEARADLRFHIQLADAAKDWVDNDEDEAFVWSGRRLISADAWRERGGQANHREERFLSISHATAEAKAARERRTERVIQARHLADIAQRCYEAQPLLGLRLQLEALLLAPQDDTATRESLWQNALVMARKGRLLRLADDAEEMINGPYYNYFVLKHIDSSGELYQTDGSLVTVLAGQVRKVFFNNDDTLLIVSYAGTHPSELHQLENMLVTPLAGQVGNVFFSSDGMLLVISYIGTLPSELRQADGTLVTELAGRVNKVFFNSDDTLLVVRYDNDLRSELLRSDGTLVTVLAGRVADRIATEMDGVRFNAGKTSLVVRYGGNPPSELRRVDGTVVVSSVNRVEFNADRSLLMVSYTGDQPSELRRADGSLVTVLAGSVGMVRFNEDGTLLVVTYYNKEQPSELRRADGSLVTLLPGMVGEAKFNEDGTLLVISYRDNQLDELRRSDGSLVTVLAGPVEMYRTKFSKNDTLLAIQYRGNRLGELRRSDGLLLARSVTEADFNADGTLVVVRYAGELPSELRQADGSLVTVLTGPASDVDFNPDSTMLAVAYKGILPGELRRTSDGIIRAFLQNRIDSMSFVKDLWAQFFFVTYSSGKVDLWEIAEESHLLIDLESNLDEDGDNGGVIINLTDNRLITHYRTGQVYLIDLAFLRALADAGEDLAPELLIELACNGPFASGLLDETTVQQAMGALTPKVCGVSSTTPSP